ISVSRLDRREEAALVKVGSVERGLRRLGLLAAHPGGRELDRLEDLDVAGAAAEIPRQRLLDLIAARFRVLLQNRLRGEEEPGRAIPALRRAQVREGLLERMETARVRHALDGLDVPSLALEAQVQTGEHRLSVHEHRAGPALAELAPVLGPGQPQVL